MRGIATRSRTARSGGARPPFRSANCTAAFGSSAEPAQWRGDQARRSARESSRSSPMGQRRGAPISAFGPAPSAALAAATAVVPDSGKRKRGLTHGTGSSRLRWRCKRGWHRHHRRMRRPGDRNRQSANRLERKLRSQARRGPAGPSTFVLFDAEKTFAHPGDILYFQSPSAGCPGLFLHRESTERWVPRSAAGQLPLPGECGPGSLRAAPGPDDSLAPGSGACGNRG